MFLEISQNSEENTCARVSFFNKVAGLKLQVFSCEVCEISKNTFLYRIPLVAASALPWRFFFKTLREQSFKETTDIFIRSRRSIRKKIWLPTTYQIFFSEENSPTETLILLNRKNHLKLYNVIVYPVDTVVQKTSKTSSERLCTFNLRPVSTG